MLHNSQPVSNQITLRPWQKQALDTFNENYAATRQANFLAVATPGAGKTTFALTTARLRLPKLIGKLVVVVPTAHLKTQWAVAARSFGLVVNPNWTPGETLPADVHGVVTTYAQVGLSPNEFFNLANGGFVILDEIHHAGAERTWGEGIKNAFSAATHRLLLSGTPFRSDTSEIPFVRYVDGEAEADFDYGYGEALYDGSVVRPIYFPRFGGEMEWTSHDGAHLAASFDDDLTYVEANQRLRAALSLDGEWLEVVLAEAVERLNKIREQHADAGGLVIAKDKEHARGIAKLMRTQFGISPEVVLSDEPGASDSKSSKKIAAFKDSKEPWIIAVKMVSEGVDIPRLRVGVYATTTTTELFFRQAVGRLVRHIKGGGLQRAYMLIPDDQRLRRFSAEIAETRNHSLNKKSWGESDQLGFDDLVEGGGLRDRPEQESLFEVHSATTDGRSKQETLWDEPESSNVAEVETPLDPSLVIDFAAAPLQGSPIDSYSDSTIDLRSEHERLRSVNSSLVIEISKLTGQAHSQINKVLNKSCGINKISEASVIQLNKRSREAEKWLELAGRKRKV